MHISGRASDTARVQSLALRMCASIARWRIQFREIERNLGLDDAATMRRAMRWELAAFRFKVALLRYAGLDEKAGFRNDQPRWPAGSGQISGQWSSNSGGGAASDQTAFSSQRRDRRDGHHYLPRAHYRHLSLSAETRKVFDDAKTGPLHIVHGWDEPHARYNEATKELMDRLLQANKIEPEQITPDQARSLVKEIHNSKDPRIRDFNMKIKLREYLHRLRGRTRGNE